MDEFIDIPQPEISDFSRVGDYLKAWLDYKKSKNKNFSVRSWAKQLGYQSPGFLGNVLSGRREASQQLLEKIAVYLNLSETDGKKLLILAKIGNSDQSIDDETIAQVTQNVEHNVVEDKISISKFQFISDWFSIAILEMFKLKDFKMDAVSIFRRFHLKIPISKIEDTLTRLERLKLIEIDETGQLKRTNRHALFIGEEIPSEIIAKYHKGHMELAIHALETQNLLERENLSMTMAIKKENVKKLKKYIAEFKNKLHNLAVSEDADEVYQVNVQGFYLTKSKHTKER